MEKWRARQESEFLCICHLSSEGEEGAVILSLQGVSLTKQ